MGNCTKIRRANSNPDVLERNLPENIRNSNPFSIRNINSDEEAKVNVEVVNHSQNYRSSLPSQDLSSRRHSYIQQYNLCDNFRHSSIENMEIKLGNALKLFSRLIDNTIDLTSIDNKKFWVDFNYCTKFPSKLTLLCFAQDYMNYDKNKHFFKIDQNTLPRPQSFNISETSNGVFNKKFMIDFANIDNQILEASDKITFPIVIEFSTKKMSETQYSIYFYKISCENEIYKAVLAKHLIKINDIYYTIYNLFTSSDEKNSECLICMTELKSIVVLPCRHICFCENCVEEVKKKHKSECPICRAKIESFLNIIKK